MTTMSKFPAVALEPIPVGANCWVVFDETGAAGVSLRRADAEPLEADRLDLLRAAVGDLDARLGDVVVLLANLGERVAAAGDTAETAAASVARLADRFRFHGFHLTQLDRAVERLGLAWCFGQPGEHRANTCGYRPAASMVKIGPEHACPTHLVDLLKTQDAQEWLDAAPGRREVVAEWMRAQDVEPAWWDGALLTTPGLARLFAESRPPAKAVEEPF